MRFYGLGGVVVALTLALGSHVVGAVAADQPKATDLIFEHKHVAKLESGKQIDYKFNRTVTDPKILGQAFSDDITLKVAADKEDGKNSSGERQCAHTVRDYARSATAP